MKTLRMTPTKPAKLQMTQNLIEPTADKWLQITSPSEMRTSRQTANEQNATREKNVPLLITLELRFFENEIVWKGLDAVFADFHDFPKAL